MEALSATAVGSGGAPAAEVVAVSVLKKAIDIEAAGVVQLLQALPAPATYYSPAHLGQRVDAFA